MKSAIFIYSFSVLLMSAPAGSQSVPNGSFLTGYCAENPKDDYCARVAEVNKQRQSPPQSAIRQTSLGIYQMIKRGNMRSSPNTSSRANIMGQLNVGRQFAAKARFTNAGITWFEIELSNGQKAYISTSLARKIR